MNQPAAPVASDSADVPCPPEGLTSRGVITRVIDGDTVVVEIRRTVRIRLLDCWAPESRTRNKTEKQRGVAAREHLQQICPPGTPVVVHIPAGEQGEVADAFSFGRALGRVYLPGIAPDLSQLQRAAGHATREQS